ncbi:MAG: nucleotidyltransferase [Rhizobiaceae bacterium]|nr:nucleotidyltransferase [Rhizobiaceae bacterium]
MAFTLPNTRPLDDLLEDLVEELQVPPGRYEQAERSYKSLGEWLHRPESTVRESDPDVYVQGSFRLGTAIKPASDEEDYDIDMVCRLGYEKSSLSQAELKRRVGVEIRAYAKRHGMSKPDDGRRCWTLVYADGAQFHMDVLPAVPDSEKRRYLKEAGPVLARLGATALAITDNEHPDFQRIAGDWPRSNPKGYALWFRDRMGQAFRTRALNEAHKMRASVEEVPTYRVRTPLQGTIQILKRHRDMMFSDRTDEKPISILITTLSAHAYNQEDDLSGALFSILRNMDRYITQREGVDWVENPADPAENFADKWGEYPERRDAFHEWLAQARADFASAHRAATADVAGTILSEHMGTALVNRALGRRNPVQKSGYVAPLVRAANLILAPAYMRKPRWPHKPEGRVSIDTATFTQKGFRPQPFISGGAALPKHSSLSFKAETTLTGRFKVYWQVVNTGHEAEVADCLRGGFNLDSAVRGGLTHTESTLYRGQHSIECFIVKNGKLAARSGQFIVNIA